MADIAINPVTRRVQFTGNTGTGPFAFTFNILQASDIVVYKNNSLLTLTTDYTVTINANGTGSITLVSALVATDVLIIVGGRELSRTTDFVTSGDLLAASLNEQLDSNVIMSQQLDERVSRAIRSQPGDELKDLYIPLKADRVDKILKFDTEGNVTAEAASAIFGGATVGANYINNTFTGDGVKTVFTATAEPGSKTNIQIYIDGIYQEKASFSISGTNVTFTEAPPLNSSIEFIIGRAITSVIGDASGVNYNQGGTGSQTRTVESKLQEFVSVKDFGAVGDGVTDDTAAIQAADAYTSANGLMLLIPCVCHIPSAITIASELVDTGNQMFTATSQATLANNLYCRPEWWGAKGDYVPSVGDEGLNGSGTNDYAAFMAAFKYHGTVKLSGKSYLFTGTGTPERLTRPLSLEGNFSGYSTIPSEQSCIYVTDDAPPFYMGGSQQSVYFKNFAMVCAKNGPAMDVRDDTATNMVGCGLFVYNCHFRGAQNAAMVADSHSLTSEILASDNTTWTAAETTTDISAKNHFNYIANNYGVGLSLNISLDVVIQSTNIRGFGVGVANWGADLTNILESRITSNGINFYDRFLGSGPGQAWGRLGKIKNSELLYNIFAPNILLDNSLYLEIDHVYYEVVGDQGVFVVMDGGNAKITDCQFDGVWRSGSQSHPFMLVNAIGEGTILRDNYYTQYLTGTPKAAPPIRFINTSTGVLSKRDRFISESNKTSVFPRIDMSDATNASYVVGIRDMPKSPNIITPTNFDGFGVEHGPSVDTGKLVFWDGVSTGKFMAAEMPIDKVYGTLTIHIVAKTQSGSGDTNIFMGIDAKDNANRTIQTIRATNISGFNDTTFSDVTVTYDMTANDMSGVTKLSFSWQTDDGLVAAIYLT